MKVDIINCFFQFTAKIIFDHNKKHNPLEALLKLIIFSKKNHSTKLGETIKSTTLCKYV